MFYNLVWVTQKVDRIKLTSLQLDRPLQLLSETSLFDGCRIFEIVLAVQGGKVGKCGSGTVVRWNHFIKDSTHKGEIMNSTTLYWVHQFCSQHRYIRPSLTLAHSCLACCSSFATEVLIPLAGQNASNCNIQPSWNEFPCSYKYWWISNRIRSWWASAPTSGRRWSVSKEGRPKMCPARPQLLRVRLHLARFFRGAHVVNHQKAWRFRNIVR